MTLGLALLRQNGKSDELGHPLGSELSRPIRSRQETDASFPEKPGVTHLSTVRCNTMTIRGPCESKCDSFLTATKPNCPHSTKVLTQLSGVSAGRNGGSAHQRSSSAMERRRRLWKRSQLRPELQTGASPFNDHLLSTGGPTSNGQNGSSPSLMRDYVANLKEQIQCLENELAHVKQSMSAVNDKSQPVAREGCAQCNATSMHLCKHKSDTSATTRLRKIVADASDTVHLSVPTCRAMHCITEGVFNCEVIDMELRKLKASYALREVHHEQFVSELRAQLEKTKTELQESQSSVVTRAEQIATQRIELLEQIHVDQRNATMQSLTEVKQQLAAVVLDAKRQQMETERLVATRQGLAEELTRWKKTAHEYEGELDVLRAEIRVLQSQVRDKNMAIEQTEATRSESITAHLNQTQREHEAPHAEWDRRALEREKAHQVHVESLEERVRTLTAQLHETRLSAERADVTVRHLETRLAQLSASDAEKDLLIETIKEATHTLKQEHLQLENALENSERRVEEWAVKYRQCAERLVHTQATLDQLKQDRRERWCTEDAMDVERQEWREERQALLQKLSAAQAERDGSHKAQSTALARVERLEVEDSVLRKEMHHYRQENALLQDELAKAHELLHRLSGTHKAFDLLKNLEDTRSGLQEVLSTQLRLGGEMVASLDKFPPIQTVVPLSLTGSSTPDKINVTTSVSGLHVDAVQPAPQLTLPSNVPYTTDSSNTRAVVPPTLDEDHSNHNEKRVSRTAVECDRPSADVTIQSIDLS